MFADCKCPPIPDGEYMIYCERHRVKKNASRIELCQSNIRYWNAWEEGRGPGQAPTNSTHQKKKRKGLGDAIEVMLSAVGITKERVTVWLGRSCGCAERQERLNQLGEWALRAVRLTKEEATNEIDKITGR